MNPKISVIVPIYNTEKYLQRCLDSIVNQSFKDIEIICIDDCSPDDSASIVKKYMAEDSRISLIRHKENKGLGGARNSGIKVACSEYIASVDSDDTIENLMLELLWEASETSKFDIICCGYDEVNEKGKKLHRRSFSEQKFVNIDNNVNIFTVLNSSFCNKLWRRSLFLENKIYFPEKIYFEDAATIPRVVMNAKYIKTINKSLYKYYQREGSITSTYSSKHMIDLFKGYEIILTYLIQRKLVNRYKEDFLEHINSGLRFHSQCVASSDMKKDEISQYLRFLLMLKVSFLDMLSSISCKSNNELLFLLGSTYSGQDDLKDNTLIDNSICKDKNLRLSYFQKIGCALFGFLFGFFISPTHMKKLRHHPKFFFRDSNNHLTRVVGIILRII